MRNIPLKGLLQKQSPLKHPTHGDHHGDPGNEKAIQKVVDKQKEHYKGKRKLPE